MSYQQNLVSTPTASDICNAIRKRLQTQGSNPSDQQVQTLVLDVMNVLKTDGVIIPSAINGGVPPSNISGNIWQYTLSAAIAGAGSNGWANFTATIAGYTTTATGNNGTFLIVASSTTTFNAINPTGSVNTSGAPVVSSCNLFNDAINEILTNPVRLFAFGI